MEKEIKSVKMTLGVLKRQKEERPAVLTSLLLSSLSSRVWGESGRNSSSGLQKGPLLL